MRTIHRIATVLAAAAVSQTAHSAVVKLDFSCQVTSYSYDPTHYLTDPFGLTPGSAIEGAIHFSTTALNFSSAPSTARHDTGNLCVTGTECPPPPTRVVGGHSITPKSNPYLTVTDSPAGTGVDRISFVTFASFMARCALVSSLRMVVLPMRR